MAIRDKAREAASKTKRRIGMERPPAAEEGGRIGIVRGALQSFGQGDMDGFLDALKDDAPFECPSGKNFPGAGDHKGPDEVKRTFVADAGRTFTSFGFEPELFVEAEDDDAVIAFGRFVGSAVEGGELDTRAVQVWEFKGNTVEAVRVYADSADFPSVVSEQEMKEQEEEDSKAEQEQESGDGEAKDESDSGDEPRGEQDADEQARGQQDADEQPKGESDAGDEQRAESDGSGEGASGSGVELARAGDDEAEAEKNEAQST